MAILAPSWRFWEPFWLQVGDLGGHLCSKLGSVGHLGSKLEVLRTILAPCWGVLRPSWTQVGRSWGHEGSKLGGFGFKLGFFGSKLRVKLALKLHFVKIAKIIEKTKIFIQHHSHEIIEHSMFSILQHLPEIIEKSPVFHMAAPSRNH